MNSRRKQSPLVRRRKVSRAVTNVTPLSPNRRSTTTRCPCSPVKKASRRKASPTKTTSVRKTTPKKATKKKTATRKTATKKKTATRKTATKKKTATKNKDELKQLVRLHNLEEDLLRNPKWRGSDGLVHWAAGRINPETGKSYTFQDLSPIYHKIKK